MTLHVESDGRGRDLYLLHGWGSHGGAWSESVELLRPRFCVHAVDLPGHGRSGTHLPERFDDAAEAVAAIIAPGAAVCGWSLGGLLAQRIAQRHPGRIAALALVSTTPCFVQRDDWEHGMKPGVLASFAAGLQQDREGTLRDFVQLNALNGSRAREAVRAFTKRLAEHGETTAPALLTALGWLESTDLRAQAADIACPTLVIHGARDALAPVEAGRWLARHVPGARMLELPDAAHLPFFTHREAFAATLESFLG